MRSNLGHTSVISQDRDVDGREVASYFVRRNPINHNGRTLIPDESTNFQPERPVLHKRCLYFDGTTTLRFNSNDLRIDNLEVLTTNNYYLEFYAKFVGQTGDDGICGSEGLYMSNGHMRIGRDSGSDYTDIVPSQYSLNNKGWKLFKADFDIQTDTYTIYVDGSVYFQRVYNTYSVGNASKMYCGGFGAFGIEVENPQRILGGCYLKSLRLVQDGIEKCHFVFEEGGGTIVYSDNAEEGAITTSDIDAVRVEQTDAPLLANSGDIVGFAKGRAGNFISEGNVEISSVDPDSPTDLLASGTLTDNVNGRNLTLYGGLLTDGTNTQTLVNDSAGEQIGLTTIDGEYCLNMWVDYSDPNVGPLIAGNQYLNFGTYDANTLTIEYENKSSYFQSIEWRDSVLYQRFETALLALIGLNPFDRGDISTVAELFNCFNGGVVTTGAYPNGATSGYPQTLGMTVANGYSKEVTRDDFISAFNTACKEGGTAALWMEGMVTDGKDTSTSTFPSWAFIRIYSGNPFSPTPTRETVFINTSNTSATGTLSGRGGTTFFSNYESTFERFEFVVIRSNASGIEWFRFYEISIEENGLIPKSKDGNYDVKFNDKLFYNGRKDFPAIPINNPCLSLNGVDQYCTLSSGLTYTAGSTYKISALITSYSDTDQATLIGSSTNDQVILGFSGDTQFCFLHGNGSIQTNDIGQSLTALAPFVIEISLTTPDPLGPYCDTVEYVLKDLDGNTVSSWSTSETAPNVSWYDLDVLFASLDGAVVKRAFAGDCAWLNIEKDGTLLNYWSYLGGDNTLMYDVVNRNTAIITTLDISSNQGLQDVYSYKLEHGFTRYYSGQNIVDIPHALATNQNYFDYFGLTPLNTYESDQEYPVGVAYVDEYRKFSNVISTYRQLELYDFEQGSSFTGYNLYPILDASYVRTPENEYYRLIEELGLDKIYSTSASFTSNTGETINNSSYSIKLDVTQIRPRPIDGQYPIVFLMLNFLGNSFAEFPNESLIRLSFDAYITTGSTAPVYYNNYDNDETIPITTSVQNFTRLSSYPLGRPRELEFLSEFFYMSGTTGDTATIIIDNYKVEAVDAVYELTPNDIRFAYNASVNYDWAVGKPVNSPRMFTRSLTSTLQDNMYFQLFTNSDNNACFLFNLSDYITYSSPIGLDTIDMSVYVKSGGSTGYYDLINNNGSDVDKFIIRAYPDGSNSGLTATISNGITGMTYTSGVDVTTELSNWSTIRVSYVRNDHFDLYVNNRLVITESLTGSTTVSSSLTTFGHSGSTSAFYAKDLNFNSGPRYLMEETSGTTVNDQLGVNNAVITANDLDIFFAVQSDIIDYSRTFGFRSIGSNTNNYPNISVLKRNLRLNNITS